MVRLVGRDNKNYTSYKYFISAFIVQPSNHLIISKTTTTVVFIGLKGLVSFRGFVTN
jgi:hypothetical protein